MRELVADSADLATAILDVPSQLAKRLELMNGPAERRQRERRCSLRTGDDLLPGAARSWG